MKPIQIKCPGCGKAYQVSNPASVGKQTQCKQCGTKFLIQPVESPEDDEGMVAPVGGGVPAHAAAQQAPAGPGGHDDEGDDEDYPDNEPTISVSAFEAQKLREQLKQGLMKPQGGAPAAAPAAAKPGPKPGPRTTVAAGKAPAAAAAAQTGGGNTFVLIALAVVVVSGLAVALFFVLK
jgi:DNA-directed RNA polymerase subunit RPC12/RpoP